MNLLLFFYLLKMVYLFSKEQVLVKDVRPLYANKHNLLWHLYSTCREHIPHPTIIYEVSILPWLNNSSSFGCYSDMQMSK